MKLTLTQYDPKKEVELPAGSGFHFTHDVERNLKSCFPDLNECVIGLPDVEDLPTFLSNGWQRLHIREHFTNEERAEAKEKLRSKCGCHVAGERSFYDDNQRAEKFLRTRGDSSREEAAMIHEGGWIMYRHYFVCFKEKWRKQRQLELEAAASKRATVRKHEEQDAKLSEAIGADATSTLETEEVPLRQVEEKVRRGPGRPRKDE